MSLPHLVGQRYAALRNLVAPNGPFALEGKKLAAALIRFQDHDALRPMLCHGLAEVTLDVKGRWMLVLRVVTLRARKAERSVRVLREDEADHLRLTIVRGAHELCQNVTNFRARLVLQPTP